MTRFFVSPEELDNDFLILTGENAAHARVLRIKNGEKVIACDGKGKECLCTVSDISAEQACLVVNDRSETISEPMVKASIYIAFPKGDKLEYVIQKATELGAYEIVVFPSSRCVSKPDDKSLRKKLERWQKIAASAAEQSGRGIVPEVLTVNNYSDALDRSLNSERAILFYENEKSTTLRMVLEEETYNSISLISGPEGGFDFKEIEEAIKRGLRICTLGKRILRCETAPLCALSAVMYQSGEF